MTEAAPIDAGQSAAIFLALLSDDDAARLLAELGPAELEHIGGLMCELGEIEPHQVATALAGFIAEAEVETLSNEPRAAKVEELLTRAVGEVKAESLMQRIAPDARPRSVEIAQWLAPSILISLIEEEHPQVITVLLLMLEADAAAQVLAGLPDETQPLVVERIARLGSVTGEAVTMLDQLLSRSISKRFGSSALTLGGPREAANLINLAAGEVGNIVMPAINERDAALAQAIEAEMFTFEMLFELDAQGMGRLLRDVENEDLVTALKGLEEDEQGIFFAAMSSRAADGVRDEMEMLPRLKRQDVLDAQQRIVDLARKLRDDGELIIGESDGEYI